MILTYIKSFLHFRKVLFSVFLIMQIIAVVSIQYAFIRNEKNENHRKVYIEQATAFSVEFYNEKHLSDIYGKTSELIDGYENKLASVCVDFTDGNLRAYFFGQTAVVNYGLALSAPTDVIVSTVADISGNKALSDTFTAGGTDFKVVGLRNSSTYNEILLSPSLDSLKIKKLNIVYSRLPDIKERAALTEKLEELFSDGNITAPEKRNYSKESSLSADSVMTFSFFVLAIINIWYIFRFVLQKRSDAYKISRLCGATKRHLFLFAFAEYLIYALISSITGALLTVTLIVPCFFDGIYYSLTNILFPIGIYLLVCMLVIAPFLIRSINAGTARSGGAVL